MVEVEVKKPLGITVCMVALGLVGVVGSVASIAILASMRGDGPFTRRARRASG